MWHRRWRKPWTPERHRSGYAGLNREVDDLFPQLPAPNIILTRRVECENTPELKMGRHVWLAATGGWMLAKCSCRQRYLAVPCGVTLASLSDVKAAQS